MHKEYSQQLLEIWKIGEPLHPIDRALLILKIMQFAGQSEALSKISIGQRNNLLLKIQEYLFGQKMDCFTKCAACKAELDFTLDVGIFRKSSATSLEKAKQEITVDGVTLTFRLINSVDLAAIIGCGDLQKAHRDIIQRCLLKAECNGELIQFNKLNSIMINGLIKQMLLCDPMAELLCSFTCPMCNEVWQQPFDIVNFLWEEIIGHSKQFLDEVICLAKVFGWSETDIMSMDVTRRKFYLSRINP